MKKIFKIVPFLLVAILVGFTAVYATSKLVPPGPVASTMYSLEDIYNLAHGTPTTLHSGAILATPGTVDETGKTLTEVYTAVASALESLPPTLTWQTDPNEYLCWSHGQYEIDNGCAIDSGFIDASLAHDGSLPLGAVEYCQYLETDGTTLAQTAQNIWHLPTIKEYESITDFTQFNNATAIAGFVNGFYWSSTVSASDSTNGWEWFSYYGQLSIDTRSYQHQVRCVR